MPYVKKMERSQEKIEADDLRRLLKLAYNDIEAFFLKNPAYVKEFKNKEVIVTLGQGSALHYIDGKNGVKDFDVWFFFPKGKKTLPYRRRGVLDFGKSKFGKHPEDIDYEGRRIDVLMRSDSYFNSEEPDKCLINYLKFKNSKTSNHLAQKAMIGLYPEQLFGKVIWPHNN
jgi:hypothetical protein